MKVPLEWLQKYCKPELDTAKLAERLTMTGTKVEGIERHGVGALEKFVVGRIMKSAPHPDADRLSVCLVDVGESEPSQIVCGAPNVAAGQTPITNVVDITNYVMLLTGQPLHAFDLDRVAGRALTVRRAQPGEPVQTLDGETRSLDDQMVLIADADGPTSIAGVMGGARSEVQADTTRVLMEVATWDGPNIHRTAWNLGLQSEASLRFEKQLQPEQMMEAQAVATRLMIDVCGATLAPGTIDVGGDGAPPMTIRLRDQRVARLLGAPIARLRAVEILRSLGFSTGEAADGLDVQPPPFRRE